MAMKINKTAVISAVAGGVIVALAFLLFKPRAASSTDEPILMAGGSLYMLAMGLSSGHHYGFGQDSPGSRNLTYQKDHGKAQHGYVSKIEIAYANNGALATDTWMPPGQSTVTYGYCDAMCTFPTADDTVTLQTNEENPSTNVQSVTVSSSVTDMTQDQRIDDIAWSHLPETRRLYWVSITGDRTYPCLPGTVECQVIIHYCGKKGGC
jgi:hypothetical protein